MLTATVNVKIVRIVRCVTVWIASKDLLQMARKSKNTAKAQQECAMVYEWARPHVKQFRTAVDVGARQGWFAMNMEKDFQHIYCFDFRDYKTQFQQTVNDMYKFTYHLTGLGEDERTAYTTSTRVGRIKETGSVAVPLRTLDSFRLEKVDMIKYDIEGFEVKAIQGSMKTIKRDWPAIVVEQNKGNLYAVELLESIGYKCLGSFPPRDHDYLLIK